MGYIAATLDICDFHDVTRKPSKSNGEQKEFSEIFVSENHKNKSYHKFLQLIKEIIANDDHL